MNASSAIARAASTAASSIARTTPDEWAGRLSAPADLSSDRGTWSTALLRHWTGTSPVMDQPPLDHHYVVRHLGGAKHVERKHDGAPVSAIVEYGALTVVPAGSQFKWHTHGPIEFAHLYIAPALLARMASRFDRVNSLSLFDRVGCRDPLLESLYDAMLMEIRQPRTASALYLDSLLESFLLKLLLDHSSATLRGAQPRETLPTFRLKRVIDFVETHLCDPLTLTDLAQIAGGSVFHFSRAFKNAVGDAPYQYVLRRRVERAKSLLTASDLPLARIAGACGFRDLAQLSKTFSRLVGTTPTRYRHP